MCCRPTNECCSRCAASTRSNWASWALTEHQVSGATLSHAMQPRLFSHREHPLLLLIHSMGGRRVTDTVPHLCSQLWRVSPPCKRHTSKSNSTTCSHSHNSAAHHPTTHQHHCRGCGRIYCDACCGDKLPLPAAFASSGVTAARGSASTGADTAPQRCCQSCAGVLAAEAARVNALLS